MLIAFCGAAQFQSLIGRLKTQISTIKRGSGGKFQSLIGRLKTIRGGEIKWKISCFNPL